MPRVRRGFAPLLIAMGPRSYSEIPTIVRMLAQNPEHMRPHGWAFSLESSSVGSRLTPRDGGIDGTRGLAIFSEIGSGVLIFTHGTVVTAVVHTTAGQPFNASVLRAGTIVELTGKAP
jgi:hypothetical protein